MNNIIWDYIDEQPTVITKLLAFDWKSIRGKIEMQTIQKIIITASGSSLNTAVILKPYFEENFDIDIQIVDPFELRFYSKQLTKESKEILLIGISQTGKSIGTLECIELANKHNIYTIALSADKDSSIAKCARFHQDILCGEESVGPKTKGVSSTTIALHLLLCSLLEDTKIIKVMNEYTKSAQFIPEVVRKTKKWCESNKHWAQANSISVVGFGVNDGVAREGALKILETMQISVMNYPVEEFMHGPHRTIVEGSKLILIDTNDIGSIFMKNLITFAKSKTKDVLLLSNVEMDASVVVDKFSITSSWLLFMVVFQVLCSYFPQLNGVNPSNPIYGDFAKNAGTRL